MTIPLIGLGTWNLRGKECEKTVTQALELGYRHIDTADVYENHKAIAHTIKGFPREQLYLVSKLSVDSLLPQQVKKDVPRFLKELNTPYLDLLLIHWPNPEVNSKDTLNAMLSFQEQGVVRAIGVSNFSRSEIESITSFPILTNQIELHPYLQQKRLVETCKRYGIVITAYRPLAKGALKDDPTLQTIGKKYHKTASQVALRWLVQQRFPTIPKASNLQHLKENFSIFDFALDEDDLQQIAALNRNQRFCNPTGLAILQDD